MILNNLNMLKSQASCIRWFLPLLFLMHSVGFCTSLFAQEPPPKLEDFAKQFEQLNAEVPVGLPTIDVFPAEDKVIELGRELFFDPILSKDKTVSCASCHRPDQAFALNKAKPEGINGRLGRRNSPTILNSVYSRSQFWDGRAKTLEEQALIPIESEDELGHSVDEVIKVLQADSKYRKIFEDTFEDGVTKENLATAIAAFERSLLSGNNVIDRFQNSDSALTAEQRRGLWLYESKGGCWQCHSNSDYTDKSFHNTGVSWGVKPLDLGLHEFSKKDEDRGKFKTPTLRDVELTAPYMHDGSIATLREVVEFYNKGGVKNPNLDPKIKPLNLSDEEVDALVEFLKALTGDHPWKKNKS